MPTNIFYALKNYFSTDIINKAAGYLGEDDVTVRKSLDLIIPATLLAIVHKGESGNVKSLMTNAHDAFESGILHKFPGTFSKSGEGIPAIGPGLITNIFGDRFGSFANAVSGFSGLKGSSSSSLISSVLMIELAVLGKFSRDTTATPGSINRLLSDQKLTILSAIPGEIDLSDYLDMDNKLSFPEPVPAQDRNSNKWLLPLILGLVGLLFLLWWLRSCNQ